MKPDVTKTARILVVDDDQGQRSLLETFLQAKGFRTQTAASGEAALQLLADEPFSMMISDVRMPGISGIETLRRVREKHPLLPVLLVTAFADIRSAVAAMRDGAVNYLAKPIDLDELMMSVRLALDPQAEPATEEASDTSIPPGVITQSPLMRAVFRDAAVIAPSETRVLITGESGVGKEVVADVIHAWSRRSAGPLVKVNCAAIPENLLESELFGHEKGSFTGAVQQRIGRFEEAKGGTIFLDEIGELPPSLQAKLLRVINDGSFRRIGSSRDLQTDARVLAATNRDLEAQIAAGRFREDLFYRLNVMEIHLPPLRERPEDILPLATHFIGVFSNRKSRFSATVAAGLTSYRWPGNVRELRNVADRCVLGIESGSPPFGQTQADGPTPLAETVEAFERALISDAMRRHGSLARTAEALVVAKTTLHDKIKKYGLDESSQGS